MNANHSILVNSKIIVIVLVFSVNLVFKEDLNLMLEVSDF